MSKTPDSAPSILIAETDPVIALDLEMRLISAGFEVLGPASSPAELGRLSALPFAGAIVSSGALGPDIEASLAPMASRDKPVLLVSGRDDLGRYFRSPNVTVVEKPVNLDDVVARMHEALEKHRVVASN